MISQFLNLQMFSLMDEYIIKYQLILTDLFQLSKPNIFLREGCSL